MEKRYSVAIYPSPEVIDLVKSMKESLAKEVGWFHSKNSVAHITICLFQSDVQDLDLIKSKLQEICNTLKPFLVCFDSFGTYANGAFFVAPAEDSKNKLTTLMKSVLEALSFIEMNANEEPHISIARQLKPDQLRKAIQLFTLTELNFVCNSIVLREFDNNLKQYFVNEEFNFDKRF